MGQRSYDARMGFILRNLTRGHRVLHRLSGGRLGRRFPGGAIVVWIATLGRKSGQWRANPLLAAPDPQCDVPAWVIAGSNAGQEKVPAWVFNVRAHAHGYVDIDNKKWKVEFEELMGAEKARCYELLTKVWKWFRSYQHNAARDIPVFRMRLVEEVTEIPGL